MRGSRAAGPKRADVAVAPVFRLLGEGRLAQAEVEALATVLEASPLPAVPSGQLTRACKIAPRSRAGLPASPTAGEPLAPRRLLARLQVNVRPFGAVAGARGGGAVHRLLFAVDDYEVTIQGALQPKQQGHLVTGQILRDGDPVPSAAILLAGVTQRAETEADADGSFRFGGIIDGSYELDVWAGEDLIVCTPLELSGQPCAR